MPIEAQAAESQIADTDPLGAAIEEAPPIALQEPPARPLKKIRVLRAGPIGAVGQERDDLPADWLAEPILNGDVQEVD